jgi:UDP-N-acetylglucosamine:LPS N-acetylglucosamine transferase
LRALQERGLDFGTRWRAILGPGYRGQCAGAGGDFGDMAVEFVRYTSDMSRHYAWADLIVCGASTTLWEALYFGLPAVVMPMVASQRLTYDALADCLAIRRFEAPGTELAEWFARLFQNDPTETQWFQAAAAAGARMVDGRGVVRVVDRLLAWK